MKNIHDILKPLMHEGERLKMHHNDSRVLELAHELMVWSLEMDNALEKMINALDA